MVITLRFLSGEDDDFYRDFKVKMRNNFQELNEVIQDEFGFEKGQIVSFYLCDNDWNKEIEFTEMDMGDDMGSGHPTYIMSETQVGNFIKKTKQRVLYVYDILREKALFGEVVSIEKNEDESATFPVCIGGEGDSPEQFDFESDDDLDGLVTGDEGEVDLKGLGLGDELKNLTDDFNNLDDLDSDKY